jgi:hypothetical protein
MSTAALTVTKLTDAQFVVLSSASQRPDRLLALRDDAHPSIGKTVNALLRRSLLEETPVRRGQPCWRRDENDKPIGAKITDTGLSALGIIPENLATNAGQPTDHRNGAVASTAWLAKPGTKQAELIERLRHEDGATIAGLSEAMGWLPHTTRAALSGLRQKGIVLLKLASPEGAPVYRIAAAEVAV